jgi:hypothetical protein
MMAFLRRLVALMSEGPVDMFAAGREYAKSRLEEGASVETLESVAANANDFDDFDRGILSVVAERRAHDD